MQVLLIQGSQQYQDDQEQDGRQAGAPDVRITAVPDESCQDGAQKQDGRQAGAPDLRITTVPDESCQDGAQKQDGRQAGIADSVICNPTWTKNNIPEKNVY